MGSMELDSIAQHDMGKILHMELDSMVSLFVGSKSKALHSKVLRSMEQHNMGQVQDNIVSQVDTYTILVDKGKMPN